MGAPVTHLEELLPSCKQSSGSTATHGVSLQSDSSAPLWCRDSQWMHNTWQSVQRWTLWARPASSMALGLCALHRVTAAAHLTWSGSCKMRSWAFAGSAWTSPSQTGWCQDTAGILRGCSAFASQALLSKEQMNHKHQNLQVRASLIQITTVIRTRTGATTTTTGQAQSQSGTYDAIALYIEGCR